MIQNRFTQRTFLASREIYRHIKPAVKLLRKRVFSRAMREDFIGVLLGVILRTVADARDFIIAPFGAGVVGNAVEYGEVIVRRFDAAF